MRLDGARRLALRCRVRAPGREPRQGSGTGRRLAMRIAAAAEGNPCSVEETSSMLIDHGIIIRSLTIGGGSPRASSTRNGAPEQQSRHCSPPDSTAWLPRERALIERASGQARSSHRVASPSRPDLQRDAAEAMLAALGRKETDRRSPREGDAPLTVSESPHPRCGLTNHPQGTLPDLHERFGRWRATARASGRPNTRRSSETTWNRRIATRSSSATRRHDHGCRVAKRPSGSVRRVTAHSTAVTHPPDSI